MIYAKINGSQYVAYEGMTQETIMQMWQVNGWTGTIIDKAVYDVDLSAIPPRA